jgi:phosphomannomutase
MSKKKILCLFDVDGTLTDPRKSATPEMKGFLRNLSKVTDVAFIGGSDLSKQVEQMGDDC